MGWVGVVDDGFGGLLLSVGVDVDTLYGSWAGAVSPTGIGPFYYFRAGDFKGLREAVRGKNPPGL